MNIKHYLSAAAALAMFAACSEYDPGLSNEVQPYTDKEIAVLEEYSQNFTERFGAIAAGHTWGFGDQGTASEALSTRGSYPNGNMWEHDGYDIPADITDAERKAVVEAFRTHTESDTQPDYSTFFVQQVYKGGVQYNLIDDLNESNYKYPDNTPNNPNYYLSSNHMDHLHCCSSDATIHDHIFDFNYGNSDDWGKHYGGRMLMVESSTRDFYYHNSVSNEDRHEYICLTVEWTEPDGSKHSGCYVGFDFYATGENPNQQVKRDWKFDDWIVKIVPANPHNPEINWHRVMCEDLGNTYDFDFNDLVFDVYFTGEQNDYIANIRVQAAGGTLPIYLGLDQNDNFEAHKLLGQETTSVPVNVGHGASAPYKFIQISMATFGKGNSTNPDDIPIYVTKTSAEGTKTTILLPTIGSTTSVAPQKICIPDNTTKWTKEHGQFGSGISSYSGSYKEGAYSYFNQWVQNPSGEYGFTGSTPWNKNGIDDSILFNK